MKKHRAIISAVIILFVTITVLPASSLAAYHSKKDKDHSKKTINTKIGKLVIDKVEVTSEFEMTEAKKGHKFLIVWLEKSNGKRPNEEDIEYIQQANNMFIKGSDGSRVNKSISGLSVRKLFIAFAPKKSAHKFRLYWPGNKSIYLGK